MVMMMMTVMIVRIALALTCALFDGSLCGGLCSAHLRLGLLSARFHFSGGAMLGL
jgi:hypothetical protein